MNRQIGLLIAVFSLSSCMNGKENKMLEGNWIEIMPANPQITQGITLHKDGSASSIGMATLQYERWEIVDNKLILWGKNIGNRQTINFSDTLDVVKLTPDSLILGKYGMYRISYYKVARIEDIKPFDLLDSLKRVDGLTELQTRHYSGIISGISGTQAICSITLYNYKHCGDGVWRQMLDYPGTDGGRQIETLGRMYTLRGDAEDPDAVVYQLVPFSSGANLFFLYLGDKLEPLNKNLERSNSTPGNTLTLQTTQPTL